MTPFQGSSLGSIQDFPGSPHWVIECIPISSKDLDIVCSHSSSFWRYFLCSFITQQIPSGQLPWGRHCARFRGYLFDLFTLYMGQLAGLSAKRTFNSVFLQIIIALEVLLNGTATNGSVECTQSCSLGTRERFLSLLICCVLGEEISSPSGSSESPNCLWY